MTEPKFVRTVSCPECKKPTEWRADNPWRPFCSERCKLIDIGAWASDGYCVPGQDAPLSEDDA
ncbi:MAG: DNA gyrase inhibitor YacG [Uliginosibacterium sp.]|jgi:endogenous inhibitor of DNA gyrase (YacG/DUF329 family)|nr:DNA gyrase inhibitor YacG [Uliginosibacterium sp.]